MKTGLGTASAGIGVAVHEAPPVEPHVATSQTRTVPGWFRQLRTLTARYLNLIRSDRRHVALLTLQGPILGLLLLATLTPRSLAPLARHALPALVTQHRGDVVFHERVVLRRVRHHEA